MNTLTIAKDSQQQQQILHAITTSVRLSASTKAQYSREVVKAQDAGVNLLDASQVADYASTLSTSSRSFLRAGLKTWTRRIKLDVKSTATPESMPTVNATLARLDALNEAIELEKAKGQKAHLWLTAGEVRYLMSTVNGRTGRRDKVVLALLVGAGLRRDEAVNLRWQDVKRQGERTVLAILGK